jgi:hypothetical protein
LLGVKIDEVIGCEGLELFTRHWIKVLCGFVAETKLERKSNTKMGDNINESFILLGE